MIRLFATLMLTLMSIGAVAQSYPGDTPAPAGIDAQPLPAITPPPAAAAPMSLMAPPAAAGGSLAVTPHEGPEERQLDQSLGLPAAAAATAATPTPEIKPSAKEDAAIEARIAAARTGGAAAQAPKAASVVQPTPPRIPTMPPTTIVGGSVSRPANVAPAPTHWEGPDERALDAADPLSGQTPIVSGTPSQDPETRKLNGGY